MKWYALLAGLPLGVFVYTVWTHNWPLVAMWGLLSWLTLTVFLTETDNL
jgi:hypothetical protein